MTTALCQSQFNVILSHRFTSFKSVSWWDVLALSPLYAKLWRHVSSLLATSCVKAFAVSFIFFSPPLALLLGCTIFIFFFFTKCAFKLFFWQLEMLYIYFSIHLACFHVLLWNHVYAVFCSSESSPLMCVEFLILISLQKTQNNLFSTFFNVTQAFMLFSYELQFTSDWCIEQRQWQMSLTLVRALFTFCALRQMCGMWNVTNPQWGEYKVWVFRSHFL